MIILFCHFRTPLPKHLYLNIQRTISLFPHIEVHLLTDQNLKSIKIDNLVIDVYSPSKDWFELEALLQHPKEFRNNFWFTSLARFIAISELSRTIRKQILHLESDVIISSDFPFDKFTNLNCSFSFPIVSSSLAISSTLYIKDSISAKYLAELTMKIAREDRNTTDMHVLRELSLDANANFQLLPSALSDRYSPSIVNSDFISMNEIGLSYFNGLFDGFDYGRYLFGVDPRNARGVSKVRQRDNSVYLNVSKVLIVTDDKRDFPYFLDLESNRKLPIFSLHIHSKNSKYFIIGKSEKAIRKAIKDSLKGPAIHVYPIITLKAVIVSLKRKLNRMLQSDE